VTLQDLLHEAGQTNSEHLDIWFPGLHRPLKVEVDKIFEVAESLGVSRSMNPPQVFVEFDNARLTLKSCSGETVSELKVTF
jgi:hypothetical protein